MTKATSLCWLWPQLMSGPNIKNISFIWCLPARLMHISAIYQTWKRASKAPSPVSFLPCSHRKTAFAAVLFCKEFYLILLPPRTSSLRAMQVAPSYTSFWCEQCPSGWVSSASSTLSTLENSIAWILFHEIVYIPTFFCRGFLLCQNTVSFTSGKKPKKPTKSPPCTSLQCRRKRCEMQHILETGH